MKHYHRLPLKFGKANGRRGWKKEQVPHRRFLSQTVLKLLQLLNWWRCSRKIRCLTGVLKKAVSTSPGQPVGILCSKAKVEVGERVVVPSKLREQGHNIPWAGHLGYRKTLDWVSCLFYCPSMNKEVQEYCQFSQSFHYNLCQSLTSLSNICRWMLWDH